MAATHGREERGEGKRKRSGVERRERDGERDGGEGGREGGRVRVRGKGRDGRTHGGRG